MRDPCPLFHPSTSDKSPSPAGSTASVPLVSIHFLPVAADCPRLWPDYCHSSCFQLPPRPPPPPPAPPHIQPSKANHVTPWFKTLASPLPSSYQLSDLPTSAWLLSTSAGSCSLWHLSRLFFFSPQVPEACFSSVWITLVSLPVLLFSSCSFLLLSHSLQAFFEPQLLGVRSPLLPL